MATRLMSAPFRAQQMLVCGQLYESDRIGRVRSFALAFLLPFGCRHSLRGRPVPPRSMYLPCGRPTHGLCHSRGTVTGFPCSAPVRCGRCRALPIPRGRGALVADIETSATTAAFQRRALFLGLDHHPPEALDNEAYRSSFSFALVWSSSCLWPVDGSPALGLSPGLHTPPLPATHAGSEDGC